MLASEKEDKMTKGNIKEKNPAEKAARKMLEEVSKAATEGNSKDPCSRKVEEEKLESPSSREKWSAEILQPV
jgi:hypothetical protein